MTGANAVISLHPRRRWSLGVILTLCLAWLAGSVARRFAFPFDLGEAVDLIGAVAPPLIVALFVVGVARASRPDEIDELEARAADVQTAVHAASDQLHTVEASLSRCIDYMRELTRASADGGALAAGAAQLNTTVADMATSSRSANEVATRLVGTLPELERLAGMIAAMGGRLETETAQQLRIIEALLGAVQVRGDEVATQADGAIASLNRQLAEVDEQSRQMTTRIAKRAYALDAAVDGASGRATTLLDSVGDRIAARMATMDDRLSVARAALDAVGEHGTSTIGRRLDQLTDSGQRLTDLLATLDTHSATVREATEAHLDALPGRLAAAKQLDDAAFDHLCGRAGALDTALAGLREPLAASGAAVDHLHGQMQRLQDAADHFEAALASGLPGATDRLQALEASSGSLTRDVEALGDALADRTKTVMAVAVLVGETRTELAALGDADLRLVDDRITATVAVIDNLGRQITACGDQSSRVTATVEAEFGVLEQQFRLAERDGETRLAAMADQIGAVRTSIEHLNEPIREVHTSLGDVDAQVAHIGIASTDLTARLNADFGVTAAAFAGMHEGAAALLRETTLLKAETAEGSAAIAAVSDRFAGERAAFAAAAATLGTTFDRAREVLDTLAAATAEVSAGTADELGRTFERAHRLAEANTAALRDMLTAVIREAEDALGKSGAEIAEAAFGQPIRGELAAIGIATGQAGELAEAAARRIAVQVRAVGTLVDGVNDKVGEMETRLDVRARDTLSARSSRLIAMLATASVDVTRLLSMDAGEQAWVRYLKGDRSIFARRAVRLIDRPMSVKIARHFAHDPQFNDEASHYLDLFEQLARRLMTDPDGDALLATVVSSDIGKLYVAIARASGRWTPVA